MGLGIVLAVWLFMVVAVGLQNGGAEVFSMRLMHRFSEEVNAVRFSRRGGEANALGLPQKRSSEYYGRLLSSDLERQKIMLAHQARYFFPSQGSKTQQLGNDFGWLHYTWIDIGSPNVSFLVALDTGSDLLWVPCDCIQCASLSASHYSSLGKDLKQYKPSDSSTNKFINCSHRLCEAVPECKSRDQPCPYTVSYQTENTSTSGFLVEDVLHLASGISNKINTFVRTPVIFGCGSKQSGSYLTGVAPDGLMGLAPGNRSVLSFLSKAGLSPNSFSLCFDEDNEGRILFGDQGVAGQNTTSFLSLDDSEYSAYVVGVAACCVETSCLEQTSFNVQVDSGTSFTFLPNEVYQKLVGEFNTQINATKSSFEGSPWQYCYNSSLEAFPKIPSVSLKFDANNSFVVLNHVFVFDLSEAAVGFCLAIQPTLEDIGIIGQNFMTGYRMVFDGENKKLGWLRSHCKSLIDDKRMPVASPNGSSPYSLPSTQQQSPPDSPAVPPAVAGRTPSPSTATSAFVAPGVLYILKYLLPFWLTGCMFLWTFK